MGKIGLQGQKGFTLIELVIVLVLLGILVSVAIPKYNDFTTEAKDNASFASAGAINAAFSIAAGMAKGNPTITQVLAQVTGTTFDNATDKFEVELADGITTASVGGTFDVNSDCGNPIVTATGVTDFVCSIDVGNASHN